MINTQNYGSFKNYPLTMNSLEDNHNKFSKLFSLMRRVCRIAVSVLIYPVKFLFSQIESWMEKSKVGLVAAHSPLCVSCTQKWEHHLPVRLEGKVVMISGGANGIGQSIVHLLASLGALPVVVDIDERKGEALCSEIVNKGYKAIFIKTDLTKEEECRQAVERVINLHGKLDILINNAGNNDKVTIHDSLERFENSLKRNLFHYVAMSKFAWKYLKESQGNILMMSSKVAMTGQGGTVGYAAAKGAVNALTRELALEGCKDNIRVNCIIPAEVCTENYMNWINTFNDPESKLKRITDQIPLYKRMTTPEEIANTAIFIISELSSHTTGQHIVVDGGYTYTDRSFGILD